VAPSATATPAPGSPAGFSFGEAPSVDVGAPSAAPIAAPYSSPDNSTSATPPVHGNGSDPSAASAYAETEEDVSLGTTDPQFSSAASMATEILAVSPEIPMVEAPDETESELITKDVTLIARGRKRRFRLH
jgi:hypothetical protein